MFNFLNNIFSSKTKKKENNKITLVFFIGKDLSTFENPIFNDITDDWFTYPLNFIFDYKNYLSNKDIFISFYNQRIKEALESNIKEHYKNIIKILSEIQNNPKFEVFFITDALDYFLEKNNLKNVLHINGLLGNFFCNNGFCLERSKSKKWINKSCPKCKKNNTIRPCINFINEYDIPFEEMEKIKKALKKCNLYIQCYSKNEISYNLLNDELIKILILGETDSGNNMDDFFDKVYIGNEIEKLKEINKIRNINQINSIR